MPKLSSKRIAPASRRSTRRWPTAGCCSVSRGSLWSRSGNNRELHRDAGAFVGALALDDAGDLLGQCSDQLQAGAARRRIFHAAAVIGDRQPCFAETDAGLQLHADMAISVVEGVLQAVGGRFIQ